jgi:hypothetical protein
MHAYGPTVVPARDGDPAGLSLFLRHPRGCYSSEPGTSYCDQVNIEWQLRDVSAEDGGFVVRTYFGDPSICPCFGIICDIHSLGLSR